MIGMPIGKINITASLQTTLDYVKRNNIVFEMRNSNRVDLNRSILMDYAIEKNFDLIMLDNDGVINTKWSDILNILAEDFKDKTIGMVLAPVIGATGMLLTQPPKSPLDEKWLVDAGSLTFCAIPLEIMKKIPIMCQYGAIGSDKPANMRIVYPTNTSEDIFLCQKIKELGYNILVDSRIKIAHLQSVFLAYDDYKDKGIKHL